MGGGDDANARVVGVGGGYPEILGVGEGGPLADEGIELLAAVGSGMVGAPVEKGGVGDGEPVQEAGVAVVGGGEDAELVEMGMWVCGYVGMWVCG